MAFQPYTDPDYAYPGAIPLVGGNLGDATDLPETSPGSRLAAYEVGDYAYPSLLPVPHVEMTIFDLDPATVTITVYRTADSRVMPVPGQINVYAVGGRNIVDWEAPFGIPLSYRAEQFDADGNSIGYTTPSITQLDVDATYVQNPFDPAHAVAVTILAAAGATLPRPTPTNVYYPAGSGVAVVISGQRQGLTDVAIPFLTETEDAAAAVRAMFGDAYTTPSLPPVIVIRTAAGQNLRLPQPFYASIPEPVETPLDTRFGGSVTRWDCTATEARRPAPALIGTVLSYADIDATYPTWAAADSAYSSYLDRDRDYSLAGTAGDS